MMVLEFIYKVLVIFGINSGFINKGTRSYSELNEQTSYFKILPLV